MPWCMYYRRKHLRSQKARRATTTPRARPSVTTNAVFADCGSRRFGGGTDEGQGINAASLDDPTLFKPQMHIWTSDAQPWNQMDPKLPKFEKYPGESSHG